MPSLTSRIALGLLLYGMTLTTIAVSGETDVWSHAPYTLGRGLDFPQQRLTVGGYLNLHVADLDNQDWSFGVQDISLFFSKHLAQRWQFFTEIEIGDALEISKDGVTGHDSEIDLERFYADYRLNPEINFRFGKFLTPVGRWNLIHAEPLVWTPDRPLTTAAPFARHAAGAMIYGDMAVSDNSLNYSLFVDDSDLLDPSQKTELAFEDNSSGTPPSNAFKRAAGIRVTYQFLNDSAHVGFSYLRYNMYDLRDRKELFGVDALWSVRRMEISGEWIYRNSMDGQEGDERGGFLQVVFPIIDRTYLIGRHEKYHSAPLSETATVNSIGVTYRPHEAISLKLERRNGQNNELMAPSGWLGSLAILF